MSIEVIEGSEILLNSVRYPLIGKARRELTSLFAEKLVTGDYTKASDPNKSSWVISDQTEGIGVEEMDETKHAKRSWWSTCDTRYRGHMTLPALATLATIPTSGTTTVAFANADMEADTDWTGGARSDTKGYDSSTYSWLVNNSSAYQYKPATYPPWTNDYRGRTFIFKCWVWASAANTGRIGLYDDATANYTYSSYHAGNSAWAQLTATLVIPATATFYYPQLVSSTASNVWFDDCTLTESACTVGSPGFYANFGGQLYASLGSILVELNAGGTGFDVIGDFGATITDMYVGLHVATGVSYLIIGLGDAERYWCMNSSEIFINGNAADFTKGVYWDEKCQKTDSEGQLSSSVDPASGSATWTDKGKLRLDDNAINNLFIYRDADADPQVYAATKVGLWVHDYTNAKWIETELHLPDHPTGGKGAVVWHDACFISSGLHVNKYIAADIATMQSVGLDEDDGLPPEYNGEINAFVDGHKAFHALVDSSLVTGVGTSGVYDYNDKGWHCLWTGATTDDTMNGGIESTVFAYRLWFDHDNKIYYLPLYRGIQSPLKIPTYTYALAGVHITPWFDADWQVGNKLALALKVNVAGDVSADETVIVSYRTDHANVTVDGGWTALSPTIIVAGLTTYTFGTSLGTAFKSIQFRFDLIRKAADTDETPDVQYAAFEYTKIIPKKWGWRFTVDCSQPYHGKAAKQLLDAMITAAELETKVTLMLDTTTKYVQIKSVVALQETGRVRKGQYEVFCTEL